MYQFLPERIDKIILAWISRVGLKIMRVLPISSETVASPRGFYKSTWDWVVNFASNKAESNKLYQQLNESSAVVNTEPKAIDNEIHWRFKCDRQQEFRPSFLALVPDGRFWNKSAVITPDNKLLADYNQIF